MPRSKARCDNFIYTWAGPEPGPRIDRSHWSSTPLRRDAEAHAYTTVFLDAFDIEMLFLQYVSCIIGGRNAFSDRVLFVYSARRLVFPLHRTRNANKIV